MLEKLDFEVVEGKKPEKRLRLLALSTCGFCKRAMAFLDSKGLEYEYIYIDKLEPEIKRQIRHYIANEYTKSILYPFLLIGESGYLPGFKEDKWEEQLK